MFNKGIRMTDEEIYQYARCFRNALVAARDDGRFDKDYCFYHFPRGCCGDTSCLLAQFFLDYKIKTVLYHASRSDYTHAWLVVNDNRIRKPRSTSYCFPEKVLQVMKGYCAEEPKAVINTTRYIKDDLSQGLLIDITGDQFGNYSKPVFVGYMDAFHSGFRFDEAHDFDGLHGYRLKELYKIVQEYIQYTSY